MRLSFIIMGVMVLALAACERATAPAPPASGAAEIPALPEGPPGPLGPPSPPDCRGSGARQQAASDNAASLTSLDWSPLGVAERGWEAYEPLIAQEVSTSCPPQSGAFADALAHWQHMRGLTPDGRMSPQVFAAMYQVWHARRPFSRVDPANCPPPPTDSELAAAAPAESYGGKAIRLKPGALEALRRMTAAARAVDHQIAADPKSLQIVSGFRDPTADLIRCAAEGSCDNRRRTWCSAHRTGTAVDLYLGQAPGYDPISTAFESRLYLSKTPAYRWLVMNAWRFGFVNYAYEPWHWEWTGDPALPPARR
jgi:D-alanyl-D-alanine carboxypeptidase